MQHQLIICKFYKKKTIRLIGFYLKRNNLEIISNLNHQLKIQVMRYYKQR